MTRLDFYAWLKARVGDDVITADGVATALRIYALNAPPDARGWLRNVARDKTFHAAVSALAQRNDERGTVLRIPVAPGAIRRAPLAGGEAAYHRLLPMPSAVLYLVEFVDYLWTLRNLTRRVDDGEFDPRKWAWEVDAWHETVGEVLGALDLVASLAPRMSHAALSDRVAELETAAAEMAEQIRACHPTNTIKGMPELVPAFRREHIGNRGAASDPARAFRGLAVREIAARTPEDCERRYAVVAGLLKLCGIEITSVQVRSILKAGRT